MKGKATYKFKKILFQSSRIDIAGGWHVGNKADNPACRYPKRGTDRDLIYNHSAITLENLMSGKLKAALLDMEDGTRILYLQYQSSSNGKIQAVVMPEEPMRIEVDRDVDDGYAAYLAVQFSSAYYFLVSADTSPYRIIREGMEDVQAMARRIYERKADTPDDMARKSLESREVIVSGRAPILKKIKRKGKNRFQVTWKKNRKAEKLALGYEIEVSETRLFTGYVNRYRLRKGKYKKTIRGNRKRTYYVRLRYYFLEGASGWSKTKKIRLK